MLFFGLFVLIGHSVVPHNHYAPQNSCEEIHQSHEASIFDILLHILEEDLGERHLEDIALQELPSLNAALLAEANAIHAPYVEHDVVRPAYSAMLESSHPRSRSPRAPPVA